MAERSSTPLLTLDEMAAARGGMPVYVSPLDADPRTGAYPTSLRGGVVTDAGDVDAIRARVEYGSLSWWWRLVEPRPDGWRSSSVATAGVTR